MNILKSTQSYEEWLGGHLRLLPADLELKHAAMTENQFSFFRATFYGWCQNWRQNCQDLDGAPEVLAVGDLHVENFGTWRDLEGRLIWGINDFDETFKLPYTLDLVRLASSARLAIEDARLEIDPHDACTRLLEGYAMSLAEGGHPVVLAEQHAWLRQAVSGILRDPVHFWEKIDALEAFHGKVPAGARQGLERMLPAKGLRYRVAHRVAGLGSLGRERYVAIALYCGGQVVREAKALAPSACAWAKMGRSKTILYQALLDRSARAKDPFVRLEGRWIVRRLAPDCSRVELSSMNKEDDEVRLLTHMGYETGNVHVGTPNAVNAIRKDLKKRSPGWLYAAAELMLKATHEDWQDWRAAHPPKRKVAGGSK